MEVKTEKKDLVWLPISLANKIKEVNDIKAIEKEILKYAEETKNSLKLDTENMDEEIIQYRAYMIKARNAFEKAKNEELDAFYAIWEKYDEDCSKIRIQVDKAKKELTPLLEELKAVKKEISTIETWGFERLGEAIQKLSSLYGENKEMFMFLVNNYKKEEKQ